MAGIEIAHKTDLFRSANPAVPNYLRYASMDRFAGLLPRQSITIRTRNIPKSWLLSSKAGTRMKDTLGVLLAGGAGERLYPLTRDRAKPAVTFGGQYRIIDITLSNCVNSDLRRVYILTQYKALSLNRHIREGWGILGAEMGEFIEVLPPMKRVSDQWYQGRRTRFIRIFIPSGRSSPSMCSFFPATIFTK